ncbi:hypothetical protein LUZ60_004516 [Juncus effusus]|nr:hypothetical protein LUZ60_004516 [Juncus effusus]
MHQIQYSILSKPSWYIFLFSLGLLSLAKFSLFLLTSIYIYLLRPAKNLRSYGKWAIVTGPTSGIGRSIAFELARNRMNLILVGRNPNKLEQVKSELSSVYESVETKIVVFDLSGDISEGITKIREAIRDMDVGLLVNNAGIVDPKLAYFHETNIEAWIEMVRVNLESTAQITRAVLPSMLEKKNGAVLSIGSGSSTCVPSWPLVTIYSSTKSFVAQFSKSLHVEYKRHGIDVQCQIPLFIETNMTSDIEKPKCGSSFLVINSDNYARAAIRSIGYETISMPNVPHFIQWCIASMIPEFILNKLVLIVTLHYKKKPMTMLNGI